MIAVVKREMLEHLQSLQFVILAVLSILLFSLNGWITLQKHREQMSRYTHAATEMAHWQSTTQISLPLRPSPLVLLADGGSEYQPPGYKLEPGGRLTPLPAGQKNFKMPLLLSVLMCLFYCSRQVPATKRKFPSSEDLSASSK